MTSVTLRSAIVIGFAVATSSVVAQQYEVVDLGTLGGQSLLRRCLRVRYAIGEFHRRLPSVMVAQCVHLFEARDAVQQVSKLLGSLRRIAPARPEDAPRSEADLLDDVIDGPSAADVD